MSTPARKEPRRRIRTRQAAIVVEISNTQGFLDVHADGLARLVQRVLHDEGIDHAAISVALVDNATIRRINRIHLAHDWPTDVISFTLSGVGEPELVGELVVSAEMAWNTATEMGAEPAAELSLYVVHGLLHLCGYDDSSEPDTQAMRARESAVLKQQGLINTFSLVKRSPPGQEAQERARWSG